MLGFALLLAANIAYAAAQWGVVAFIARLGSLEAQGQYAYALAITAPLTMLLRCNLSAVLATDHEHRFRYQDYLHVRLALSLAFLIVVPVLAVAMDGSLLLAGVAFSVACFKSVEGLSDIAGGALQRGRLFGRLAAAMTLRAGFLLAAFLSALVWTGSVRAGALLTACMWLLVFFLVERPALPPDSGSPPAAGGLGRAGEVLAECWPLGATMALVSLISYMPIYVLQSTSSLAEVGRFAAVNYLGMIGGLLGTAAVQAAAGRLAQYYHESRAAYLRLFGTIAVTMLAGSAVLIGLIDALGERVLIVLYGQQYAGLGQILSITAQGIAVTLLLAIFGLSLTIFRAFRAMLLMNVVSAGVVLGLCLWLIPDGGIEGAARALLYGLLVKLVLSASINLVLLRGRGS
jgi:O-antigen/teichoic acid export membrane protein